MWLLDGATATVVALRTLPGVGPMWDLTLDSVHTFAVGVTQAVVHNCPPEGDAGGGGAAPGIPSAQSLAPDVANATSGTLKQLKSGYSVTVPYGRRGIMVRIMEAGGGRTNYYRISIPGLQTFTGTGAVSTDPALTHIPISNTSLQDILNRIAGIGR